MVSARRGPALSARVPVLLGLLDLPLGGARQVLGAVRDHDDYRRDDSEGDVDEEGLRLLWLPRGLMSTVIGRLIAAW